MRWIPPTLVGLIVLAMAAAAIAATLNGSSRGERLAGTSTADVIRGKGGNDTLLGRRGSDRLIGGRGRDRLIGGPGNDVLVGGPAKDVFAGGPGNDRVNSRDGTAEAANCGTGGKDVATVDAGDRTNGCETVLRPGGVDPALGDPPPPTPLERGFMVFNRSCSSCHGVGAVGGGAPRLAQKGLTDERIRTLVVTGGGGMPAGLVSGQRLEDVIAYLRTLQ